MTANGDESPGRARYLLQGWYDGVWTAALEKACSEADDVLFQWARHGERDASACVQLMRGIRLRRVRALEVMAWALQQPEREPAEPPVQELALQDSARVELDIAVEDLAVRIEQAAGPRLVALRPRLRIAAVSWRELLPESLIEARVGARALADAVSELNVDVGAQVLMFKLVERLVTQPYLELLDRIDAFLTSRGIPQAAPPRPQVSSQPQRSRAAAGPAATATAQNLQQLWSRVPGWTQPINGAAPRAVAGEWQVLGRLVDSVLARMDQVEPLPPDASWHTLAQVVPETDALLAWRLRALALQPPQNLAHSLTDYAMIQRAQLVGELFDQYDRDPLFTADARALLHGLRWPMIKVALSDPGFLVDLTHPVRSLLEYVVSVCVGSHVAAADGNLLREFILEIERTLTPSALRAFQGSQRANTVAAEEIKAARQRVNDGFQVRRRRLIARARGRVTLELNLRLEGRRFIDGGAAFIEDVVKPLLGVLLLRKGERSPEWQHGLALLDRVVKLIDTCPPDRELQFNTLKRQCAAQMRATGFSPARIDAALQALNLFQQRRGAGLDQRVAETVTAEDFLQAAEGRRTARRLYPGADGMRMLWSSLEAGQWYRMVDPATHKSRFGQLLASNDESWVAEFQGIVPDQRFQATLPGLAEEVRRGALRPLESSPLFERAAAFLRQA